jgi:hypothetical protein
MRITKKYAGASCLGRRVYQFRDRVHPTITEIQVAKVELDHLEQRFRLRIEGGHPIAVTSSLSSIPSMEPIQQPQSQVPNGVTNNNNTVPLSSITATPTLFQNQNNILQTMLLGLSALQQQNTSLQQTSPPTTTNMTVPAPNPVSSSSFSPPIPTTLPGIQPIPPAVAQILLANVANSANPFGSVQYVKLRFVLCVYLLHLP